MLRVKEVTPNRIQNKVGNRLREKQGKPPSEVYEGRSDEEMKQQCQKAVPIPLGIPDERHGTHSDAEDEEVAEEDRQRMPHEEIPPPVARRRLQKMTLRHDRERTDVGATKLRIVLVMMSVRTAPDGARTEEEDSDKAHQALGDPGARKNRVMLLIVIDHEQSEKEKPAQDTAADARGKGGHPLGPRESCDQKCGRGQNMPPTTERGIGGEILGGNDKVGTGFESRIQRSGIIAQKREKSIQLGCTVRNFLREIELMSCGDWLLQRVRVERKSQKTCWLTSPHSFPNRLDEIR